MQTPEPTPEPTSEPTREPTPEPTTVAVYKNIMELLVEEEVERQLDRIPPQKAAYFNELEIIAYALNQLPALYATNEKGLDHQLQRGRTKLGAQITQAVQRALIAVQRDPFISEDPLKAEQFTPLENILNQLRSLLQEDCLDWETLPNCIDRALKHARREGDNEEDVNESGKLQAKRHETTQASDRHTPLMPTIPGYTPSHNDRHTTTSGMNSEITAATIPGTGRHIWYCTSSQT